MNNTNEKGSSDSSTETAPDLPQQQAHTRASGSILKYVTTTFTSGSSIADLSSDDSNGQKDVGQARREEDNMALWRIDSIITSTNQPSSLAAAGNSTAMSTHIHSGSALGYKQPTPKQSEALIHRHKAKPSVPVELETEFFEAQPASASGAGAANQAKRLSSLSSIPSSTESFRERKLQGALVRKSSLNWEVASKRLPKQVAQPATGGDIQRPPRAVIESARQESGRAWADFSDDEFENDDNQRLVQVGPEEWKLRPRSRQSAARTQSLTGSYRPPRLSEFLPEEHIPEELIIGGSASRRMHNKHPDHNPLWAPQYSYPAVQNLNAAVQHAATEMHALKLENGALKREARVNEYKIKGLEEEVTRLTGLLQKGDLAQEDEHETATRSTRQS